MKFVLSSEMEEEVLMGVGAGGNTVKLTKQLDPREALGRVLHDSGLDVVRTVLDHMPSDRLLPPGA